MEGNKKTTLARRWTAFVTNWTHISRFFFTTFVAQNWPTAARGIGGDAEGEEEKKTRVHDCYPSAA